MSWRQLFLSSPAYFTLSTIWIVSCGQPSEQPPTTQGVLSEVDGVVRLLNSAEERQLCSVQYCEPNYVYHTHFARKRKEPDPLNEELIDYSKAIMNVPQAWELTQGDSNVVVAVIDSGVDYTHSDLRENMWLNALEELGEPGVDDDENGYVDDVYGWDFHNNRPNAMDDNRHGTHVAGTIAAAADGHGTIGVAPKVRVMPLKFLSAAGGGSTLNAIRAIEYAVKNGAQVISNSWGGPYYSKFLEEAVLKAQAQGAILVAAAGNSAHDNDQKSHYPSNYAGVISVASSDSKDELSDFSNFGAKTVFIAAPGDHIFSTVLKNEWGTLSGTSMATPQVSGAIALALSLNSKLKAEELKAALCSSAASSLSDQTECGRLDVAAFLKALIAKK